MQSKGIHQKPVTILPAAEIERLKQADEKKEIAKMRGEDDGPLSYEDNPFFVRFHESAAEMRRDNPGRFNTNFEAEAELARIHPHLYDAAWGRKAYSKITRIETIVWPL